MPRSLPPRRAPAAEVTYCNLLGDPVFTTSAIDGTRQALTLPQVLARLADPAQQTLAFVGLQAHQQPAWAAFLAQVGAMALQRAQVDAPWTDAAAWADALRHLGGGDAAWTLVVDDLAQPAFLQPPVPEGSLDGFKNELASPGALDLLVVAKNHDRKLESGDPADAAAWIYALVSLQTQQGYSGKANYGVFRMNGGLGNRPRIGLESGHDLGAVFRRDLAVLREQRTAVLERGLFADEGQPLLWTEPWTGTTSLAMPALDPWAVECCRRVRLRRQGDQGDRLVAVMASTAVARVATADDYTGNCGDPWTPIGRGSTNLGKSLTLPGAGFTYQRVADLLFTADWEPPAAQALRADDGGDLHWCGRALVRGQGKTEGWHERVLPIPPRLRPRLRDTTARKHLGEQAKTMILAAKAMRLDILKPALRALWEDTDGRIEQALERLEHAVDADFFEYLWDHPDEAGAATWRQRLAELARGILTADSDLVGPSRDRWRRLAAAQRVFHQRLHHHRHGEVLGVFLAPPQATIP